MAVCLASACRQPAAPYNPLCRDHWESIEERAEDLLRRFRYVYIGRTCDPEARAEEHREEWGARGICVLFESRERRHVERVESCLIRSLKKFKRLRNRTDESLGPYRSGYNCVYLAYK